MKPLTLFLFFCFFQSLSAQIENRIIYKDDQGGTGSAEIAMDHHDRPMLLTEFGSFKAIIAVDEFLKSAWNLHVNIVVPSTYKNQQHPQLVKTKIDSAYLYAADRQLGESSSLALLLLTIDEQGDTTSSSNIRLEKNFSLRDMLIDHDDMKYVLLGTEAEAALLKLDESNNMLWSKEIFDNKYDLDIKSMAFTQDSSIIIFGDASNLSDDHNELIASVSREGEIEWCRLHPDQPVIDSKCFTIDEGKLFSLVQTNEDLQYRLSITDTTTYEVETYSGNFQHSEFFEKSYNIIDVVDSIVVFTAGSSIFKLDYKNNDLEFLWSYLETRSSAVVDSSQEFFLVNVIGVFPVAPASDYGSFGLFQGFHINSLVQDDCIWEDYGDFFIDTASYIFHQLEIDDLSYEMIILETDVEHYFTIDKIGCLDPGNSLSEIDVEYIIDIFPNPSSESISIELENGIVDYLIVTDLMGRRLMYQSHNKSTDAEIDVSSFNPGVYLLSIQIDRDWVHRKFVVSQ